MKGIYAREGNWLEAQEGVEKQMRANSKEGLESLRMSGLLKGAEYDNLLKIKHQNLGLKKSSSGS